jgi:CHAT domain-containing protein
MTRQAPDLERLLGELLGVTPERRAAFLRAQERHLELFDELTEHAERLAVSDVTRSLEASSALVRIADELGDDARRARTRRVRGQALAYAGKIEEALPWYIEAAEVADRAGSLFEAARARMSSMHALNNLGRFDESLAAGEAARVAFLSADEPMWAARADSNLGNTQRMRDNPAAALAHFDRARPLLVQDPTALAQLDSNRAHALMDLDRFDDAERAYQSALPRFEAAGMSWAAAIVEGNLADLATRQGRLSVALYHFERARRHLEQDTAESSLARLATEHADALATLGLLEDALDAYRHALVKLVANGLVHQAVHAQAGLGRILVRMGRLDEAETWLTRAAQGLDRLGQSVARARLDLVRAAILHEQGRTADAHALVTDALLQFDDRPTDAAAAHEQLARLALDAGDAPAALGEIDRAIAAVRPLDLAPLMADLLRTRGRVLRALNRPADAAADFRASVEQIERVRGSLQAERFRTAYLGRHVPAYEDLVATVLDLPEAGALAEAFRVVEQARSRSLLESIRRALDEPVTPPHATGGEEAPLARRATRLRSELNALYSRLADAERQTARSSLADLRSRLKTTERELAAVEDRLAAARGLGDLFAPPIELEAALARLRPGTTLLEYFIAGDELLAFVLRNGDARCVRRLARAAELRTAVQRLQFQIQRGLRPGAAEQALDRRARLAADAQRELTRLHALLIAPLLQDQPDADGLIIAPHSLLHAVPFHALTDGRAALLDRHDITLVPSASLLEAGVAPAAGRQADAVVFGVPDAAAPHIAAEASAVARTLNTSRLLLGSAATAAALLAHAGNADVLHIACHGQFSATHPQASGLRMTDRWVTVRELYQLKLRAALVTLSGCETGRAAVHGGDEHVGLTRSFLAAGARRLIVSLWTVHDASTTDLMQTFYREWDFGRGPARSAAAALRNAQRALRATHPHPAFWAPFVLIGER